MGDTQILDISWRTIAKIAISVICFFLIFLIRDILIWFLFALIISILFNPLIDFLHRKRLPRTMAIIFVYVAAFGLISLSIYAVVPLFIQEIRQFSQLIPEYFEKISPPLKGLGLQAFENVESFLIAFGKTLESMASSIFSALFAIFGGIFSTVFVIAVAIFLSLEERAAERTLSLFSPKKYEAYVLNLWRKCQKKVSGWFLTRVLACLFVGVASYVAFLLFNVKYPFSLGLLAGILNFIPIVGPIITGLLIFIIVSLDSFLRSIFVLVVFVLIQQIEGNILTPILSKKFIGIPPVLVLIALFVGAKLWGFLGAVLAIPLAGILFEFLRDFLRQRKEEKENTAVL